MGIKAMGINALIELCYVCIYQKCGNGILNIDYFVSELWISEFWDRCSTDRMCFLIDFVVRDTTLASIVTTSEEYQVSSANEYVDF